MTKINFVYALFGFTAIFFISIGHIAGPLNNNTLLKVTGAPGENTCNFCHTSFPNNSGGNAFNINFNNGYNFYTPGTTYNITVSLGGSLSNKYGFQMTSLKSSDDKISGKFFPTANTDTFYLQVSTTNTNKRRYIEHNQNNTSGSWTFQWQAPASNVGNIKLYGAGVAGENPTGTVNDYTYSSILTLSPLVPPIASFSVNDTIICAGESATFSSQSSAGTTLQWEFTGGNPASSTMQNPVIAYNTPGQYKVKLIASNPLGSDSVVYQQFIHVYPKPLLIVSATDITCYGDLDGTVSALVSGGTPAYSYAWNTGSTNQNLLNLAKGGYCLTLTDIKGCTAVACDSVHEPPILLNTVDGTDLSCFGAFDGTVFCNTSGGVQPYIYHWNTGDSTGIVSGLAGGNYSVTLTDFNGCELSGSTNITEPIAITTFSIINPLIGGLNNGAINLSVTGGIPPYTFFWSNGKTNEDIDSLAAGTYFITITDSDSCQKIDSFLVGYSLGLDALADKGLFSVSPNPASNELSIAFLGDIDGLVDLAIIDLNGKPVFSQSNLLIEQQKIRLLLPFIHDGIYLLVITTATSRQAQKLTITR